MEVLDSNDVGNNAVATCLRSVHTANGRASSSVLQINYAEVSVDRRARVRSDEWQLYISEDVFAG